MSIAVSILLWFLIALAFTALTSLWVMIMAAVWVVMSRFFAEFKQAGVELEEVEDDPRLHF